MNTKCASSNSLHRQHGGDLLALLQREQVDDRLAAPGARALRHLVDLQPVHPAAAGEAQDVVVRVGDEQALDEIVFLGRGGLLAAAAAALRAVVGQRLRLDVAGVREASPPCPRGVIRSSRSMSPSFRTISLRRLSPYCIADRLQFVADDLGDALGPREDVDQVGDLLDHLAVLGDDLVLLEAGEALQAQFEDRLGLRLGQAVALGGEAEFRRRGRRARTRRWRRGSACRRPAANATGRAIRSCLASAGVCARLISSMISSTFDSATARPSSMWPRSRALRSSNSGAARHHLAPVREEGLAASA